MSGNLGDFIAKGVITIAEVQEGDSCLEDMGIMEIEPGQTIVKCESAKAVKPVGQANARIAELEDQLAAAKKELVIARGQLSVTLNNWEQAKGKLRREKAALDRRSKALDERDALTAEDISAEQVGYWKGQAEKARSEAEYYREKLSAVLDLAHDIESAAR